MTDEEKKNYERSYSRMWDEIRRERELSNALVATSHAGRDLALALRRDIDKGAMLSEESHGALKRLEELNAR